MNKDLAVLIEQRHADYESRRNSLLESWKPTIDKAEVHYKAETSKEFSPWMRKNIAQMLENCVIDAKSRSGSILETTDSSDISFLGVQLPIVLAIMPSLVLNDISVMQSLEQSICLN